MKRYIVIFLLAALLTGCGSSAVTEDITTAEQTTAEQTESPDTDETDIQTDVFSEGIKD
ncbi:MAG: membrane lipoprotein lipid attachment site-containing protein, partial [Firmicutes bacterium]|nr:membrane lipoprotein lipid attachment site-containing protein [Bacillota bacterium]